MRGNSLNCSLVGRALFGPSFAVFVKDNIAYSCHGASLLIFDIINPSNPILLSYYDTGGYAIGVYIQDTIAYVADGDEGLRLINVSNPDSPTEIGYYDTGDFTESVYVQDSIAYVADGNDGLRLINVSNPFSPYEIGYYDTIGNARCVYVQDSIAYVADWIDGLRLINVSNPDSPTEIGYYDTGGYATGVYVKDKIAYIADDYGGLYIIAYNPIQQRKIEKLTNPCDIYITTDNALRIKYSIWKTAKVLIEIYSISGRKLFSNESTASPGIYSIKWNGKRGVYFIKVKIDENTYSQKGVIIK
jgi:hypothetical protein